MMDPRVMLVGAFVLCALLGAVVPLLLSAWMSRRYTATSERIDSRGPASPQLSIDPDFFARQQGAAGIDRWFQRLVAESGLSLGPEVAFLMAVAVGIIIGGGLFMWMEDLLAGAAGLLVGIVLVMFFYMFRRSRRRAAIQDQLPDVMDLLARAVRAGESLDQAIQLVGETANSPLGPEFRRCSRQLEMGLSIGAAMRALARRAPITEIRILSATLMVQRQTGGNLPITLERLGKVIRDRISYHRQFRAATGAGRLSTALIAAAGPLVALYLIIWQREYINKFMESSHGQLMLGIAIGLQLIGLIWIYLLLRSDY